jgi:hypothetical protein
MNRDEALRLMGDYLEGTLPDDVRIAFEAYLLTDPEAQEELEHLRALTREATALPEGIAPRRDLWPEIETRVRAAGQRGIVERVALPMRVRTRTWRPLAAVAAVVLLAFLSVSTARYLTGGMGGSSGLPPFLAEAGSGLVAWQPAEEGYLWAIDALSRPVKEWQTELPDIARISIMESLLVMDNAIASSKLAIEENPTDPALHVRLSDAYQTKLELLEWTTQIISLN